MCARSDSAKSIGDAAQTLRAACVVKLLGDQSPAFHLPVPLDRSWDELLKKLDEIK